MGLLYSFGLDGGLSRDRGILESGLNRVVLLYCLGANVMKVLVKT